MKLSFIELSSLIFFFSFLSKIYEVLWFYIGVDCKDLVENLISMRFCYSIFSLC